MVMVMGLVRPIKNSVVIACWARNVSNSAKGFQHRPGNDRVDRV